MTRHQSGRDVLSAALAIEGLAVARWLIPASIHIVKWPESGPVRLALLAPTWELLVLLATGLILSVAVAWRGAAAQLRSIAGPLLLLWIWVVPFLPWLPDRLPLLLVLAGPVRWAIAAVAITIVLLATTPLQEWVAAFLRLRRRTVFVLSLIVYLGIGLYSEKTVGPGGDEPHYLIITESLLKDGDLKIENNHRQGDYRSYWAGDLRPDFFERGKNGEIYSIHAPGLPALVLPAYAIAGRAGAVAFIAFLAALTALAVFDLAEALAGTGPAVLAWAGCCLTVPFVPYAWLIFPELPGGLLVAWAALWTRTAIERPALVWLLRGVALAWLPWLHTKFAVFLAIFAAALAWRLLRRLRLLIAFAAPIAVSGALWLYSFYAIYGVFDPEAPYGDYTKIYVLTRNIPHGLLGLFFSQKFGLLPYAPIYLAAVAGAWIVLRDRETRFLGGVLLLTVAAFVASTARLYMFWGGSSAPARFLVPLLPCLAPLVALAFKHAQSVAARALLGMALAISLAAALFGVLPPDRLTLFSDPHSGGARLLEFVQAGSPFSLVAPAFTEPTWGAELGSLVAWLVVAIVAMAALFAVARLGSASAWQLAGVASLVFLLGGAILSATPSAGIREVTARRNDLDVLNRYDGTRFRTLDYQTLSRATPDRIRDLLTLVFEERTPDPSMPGISSGRVQAGPVTVPPGSYDAAVTFFADTGARQGEISAMMLPATVFGRVSGALDNPATIAFQLPVTIRRLLIQIPDKPLAASVRRIDLIPRAVVPPADREDVPVRTVETLPDRSDAYLVYTDEHAYPEKGIFWSRGTEETRVMVAADGITRLTLTLSTGPMAGTVAVSALGQKKTVAMRAGEIQVVSWDVAPTMQRLIPVTVQSSVMFRPAEMDKASTDMRGLGCQVRIGLE